MNSIYCDADGYKTVLCVDHANSARLSEGLYTLQSTSNECHECIREMIRTFYVKDHASVFDAWNAAREYSESIGRGTMYTVGPWDNPEGFKIIVRAL